MITALNHITLAVLDVKRSFDFYHETLGLKPLCRWHAGAYFLLGNTWFCLNQDPLRVPNPCYTHYAFSVSHEDFEIFSKKLLDAQVPVFKENTSPGESLYFLDPDGHKLEIHTGNWQTRLATKKANPGQWQEVEWYINVDEA
ncbi:MAG: VOC family protein [Holosporales bacterium]